MDSLHLRTVIIKSLRQLSDDDRKRLHFYFGHVVSRRMRDDISHSGTLAVIDSLSDKGIIDRNNSAFLIDAFDGIECVDVVNRLRDRHDTV